MTVAELLTGVKQPLSNKEFVEWQAFYAVKAHYEEQASKK